MSLKKCCVYTCSNTSENSPYGFYNFPTVQFRYRRVRWIRAVRKTNGKPWKPVGQSVVCGAHFVNGEPSLYRNYENYLPTMNLTKMDSEEYWSPKVSVKQYAEEYIKYDALVERPNKKNSQNEDRKRAYTLLAKRLGVNVATVRSWERRFWSYMGNKIATLNRRKAELPDWIAEVEERLHVTKHLQTKPEKLRVESPRDVLSLLCVAASRHGALCSSQLYHDVRRALRINYATGISKLHAVWVQAQRVSLSQVCAAARGGDRPGAAPDAARVADLVLLHTDVQTHQLLTNECVELFEESEALHELWRLVQRHLLEEELPRNSREQAQRWTRAHRDYLNSGRTASIVVLQRRWHELKLQARERLAAHWRRATAGEDPTAQDPGAFTGHQSGVTAGQRPGLSASQDPGISTSQDPGISGTQDPGTPVEPAPPPPPPPPRPALLHLAILKRYPHIARSAPASWHQLVRDGLVVTEPLESDMLDEDVESVALDAIDNAEDDTRASGDVTSDDDASHSRYALYTDLEADVVKADDSGSEDDDNLVIDEPDCFTDPLNIYKNARKYEHKHTKHTTHTEPATNTDNKHIYDTHVDQPAVSAESSAEPTLQVLSLMDPTSLKTELIFESDDEQPSPQDNNVEIPLIVKQEDIRSRLVFDDDDDATGNSDKLKESDADTKGDIIVKSDLTGKDDMTGKNDRIGNEGLDGNNDCANSDLDSDHVMEQQGDDTNNKSAIDYKLLLESRVELKKVDKIPAWKKYAQNNTIEVSRIIDELPAPRKLHMDEIKIEKCSEIVPSEGVKRELRDTTTVELEVPAKMMRADTDSEDEQPLTSIRVNKRRHKDVDDEYKPSKKTRRNNKRDSDTDTSSDGQNELLQEIAEEQHFSGKRAEGRRFKSAASTLQWSERFPDVYGEGRRGRAGGSGPSVAKRVQLPDIEHVRRVNSGILTAQVAPITAPLQSDSASSVEEIPGEPEVTETLWCDDNMPPPHKLDTVLAELTTECAALEAAHCCAARRHVVVNDTRRRMGLPNIALHKHVDGVCACCCLHLCDEAASTRARLAAQLSALHTDICHVLELSAVVVDKKKKPKGKEIHKKKDASVSEARSPSPTSMFSMAGTSAGTDNCTITPKPSTQTTQSTAQPSQAMIKSVAPVVTTSSTATPSTLAEPTTLKSLLKSKKKSSSCNPSASAKAEGYDEWMRQKSLYAKYFIMPSQVSANKNSAPRAAAAPPNVPASNVPASNVPASNVPNSYVPATNIPNTYVPATNAPLPYVLATFVPAPIVPAPIVPATMVASNVPPSNVLVTNVPPPNVPTTKVPPPNIRTTKAPATNVPAPNVRTTKVPPSNVPATKVPAPNVRTTKVPPSNGPATDVPPPPNVPAPNVPATNIPPPNVPATTAAPPSSALSSLSISNTTQTSTFTITNPKVLGVGPNGATIILNQFQSVFKSTQNSTVPLLVNTNTTLPIQLLQQNNARKSLPKLIIAQKISQNTLQTQTTMTDASGNKNKVIVLSTPNVTSTRSTPLSSSPGTAPVVTLSTLPRSPLNTEAASGTAVSVSNPPPWARPKNARDPPQLLALLASSKKPTDVVPSVSAPVPAPVVSSPPVIIEVPAAQLSPIKTDEKPVESPSVDKVEPQIKATSARHKGIPNFVRIAPKTSQRYPLSEEGASGTDNTGAVTGVSETKDPLIIEVPAATDETARVTDTVKSENTSVLQNIYVTAAPSDGDTPPSRDVSLHVPPARGSRVHCVVTVNLPLTDNAPTDPPAPPTDPPATVQTIDLTSDDEVTESTTQQDNIEPKSTSDAAEGSQTSSAPVAGDSDTEYNVTTDELIKSIEEASNANYKGLYMYKRRAGVSSAARVRCGGGVLRVDAAGPPLSASADAAELGPGADAAGRLVLTRRRLPQRSPTYWTLAPFAAAERLLSPHDSRLSPSSQAAQADCNCGHSQHHIEVLSAVRTVKQLRELTSQGAPLFLLSKRSGRYHPLRAARNNQDTG